MTFIFPHPTLIRKEGAHKGNTFNPEGLDLIFCTHNSGIVNYDIPFGVSTYKKSGIGYFCPLSTCFFQYNKDKGGLMVSPQTGEQAFSVNSDNGEMTVYLGASTTSGPIRNVGLHFLSQNDLWHEPAWYSEPFHGTYNHKILIYPFKETWQDDHIPSIFRSETQPVYIRKCKPQYNKNMLPAEKSFLQYDTPNVEITTMDLIQNKLLFRLNEREGRRTDIIMDFNGKKQKERFTPFAIITNSIKH